MDFKKKGGSVRPIQQIGYSVIKREFCMIIIKKPDQIMLMKKAGKITAEALLVARDAIKPGVSTKEVDTKIRRFIEKCGAHPSFLGYNGFPGSACISINDQVIHGIPSDRVIIKEGDIVILRKNQQYYIFLEKGSSYVTSLYQLSLDFDSGVSEVNVVNRLMLLKDSISKKQ